MKLKIWRKNNNLSLSEAAEKLEVDESTFYCYEIGKKFPRPGMLSKIFEATNGDVNSEDMLSTWKNYKGKK